jgi:hypothetical protein
MKKIYLLENPSNSQLTGDMAKQFLGHHISTNENFAKRFLFIVRHLRNFEVVNGEFTNLKLYKGELVYTIQLPDALGFYRESIIIKKLNHFSHTYEIRINDTYYKHRVLFLFSALNESLNDEDNFFVLSYGFTKIENGEDNTNYLAFNNDLIKKDIIAHKANKSVLDKWLGGVWNEL